MAIISSYLAPSKARGTPANCYSNRHIGIDILVRVGGLCIPSGDFNRCLNRLGGC